MNEPNFCLITYIVMAGLRNLLIHEYAEIDIQKLYSFLDSIDDLKNFIIQVEESLK